MRKALFVVVLFLPTTVLGQGLNARVGTTLPAQCNPSRADVFFKTTAPIGLYECAATNSWVKLGDTTGIGWVIDGGGSAITTGSKGVVPVPFRCVIDQATLLADQTGSIVVDVKKATYAAFPTTTSIAGSALPTLSSAQKSQTSTLTGWTTQINTGDIIEWTVNSASTVTRVTVFLRCNKN